MSDTNETRLQLSTDLEELLRSFQEIMFETSELAKENEENQRIVQEKETELAKLSARCQELERETGQKQEFLELIHTGLSHIPGLKEDIEKYKTKAFQLESRLAQKDQEMARLKEKHLDDLNFLRQDIEEERIKRREKENKRVLDLEELFKQAQVVTNENPERNFLFTLFLTIFRFLVVGILEPHEEGWTGEAADDGSPQQEGREAQEHRH